MKKVMMWTGVAVLALAVMACDGIMPEQGEKVQFVWTRTMGGVCLDFPTDLCLGDDDYLYISGRYQDLTDFPELTPTKGLHILGSGDLFYQVTSKDSEAVLIKTWHGREPNIGVNTFIRDSDDNSFICGTFTDTVDFDPDIGIFNKTCNGQLEMFILKLNSFGNFSWVKTITGTGYARCSDIAADNTGSIYLSGIFEGTVDFDPNTGVVQKASSANSDAFLLKLDSNGNFIWVKTIGNTGTDGYDRICFDEFGSTYIVGNTNSSSIDLDPDIGTDNFSTTTNSISFLSKFSLNGDYEWSKVWSSYTISDTGIDNAGNIVLTGSYSTTIDFDPGSSLYQITSQGDTDIFLIKLNQQGDFISCISFGGAYTDSSMGMAIDRLDNIYLIGGFQGTVDFNPGPDVDLQIAGWINNMFCLRINADDSYGWSTAIVESVVGNDIAVDDNLDIYITGYFENFVDFLPGPAVDVRGSNGDKDVFLTKIHQLY